MFSATLPFAALVLFLATEKSFLHLRRVPLLPSWPPPLH